ncbi:hypothetical protein L1987_37688 [Smallanthus sonchifolius]|uniref:Uncharacterized protein n=1 Tax=Smallanthus sonchifolius TaxID=185202 RepID=A0ACB9HGU6_9ASTR|nr:hypothetical protein L1987_37688 [Smallanthus sonchifolius]
MLRQTCCGSWEATATTGGEASDYKELVVVPRSSDQFFPVSKGAKILSPRPAFWSLAGCPRCSYLEFPCSVRIFSERTVRRWLQKYDLKWTEFFSRNNDENKPQITKESLQQFAGKPMYEVVAHFKVKRKSCSAEIRCNCGKVTSQFTLSESKLFEKVQCEFVDTLDLEKGTTFTLEYKNQDGVVHLKKGTPFEKF